MNEVVFALLLTLAAGMATAIGSVIAFASKNRNPRFLSVATGFSAGVMLYVSFVEIFPKGAEALVERFGDATGNWVIVGSFFAGILLIGVIDFLIPARENPHEIHAEELTSALREANDEGTRPYVPPVNRKLMRMGLFTALAIAIHNFPEGMATFLVALDDPTLGIAIAIAIALHNIPEGISVSVPIYYATGRRKTAFFYSSLSGLAEPLGALAGYALLLVVLGQGAGAIPQEAMGILFGAVAGIMVYISLDELLPTSRAYGKEHDSLLGLVAGMAVMALSLLLTK